MLCNYRRHFWKQETPFRSPAGTTAASLCKKTMKKRKKLKERASDWYDAREGRSSRCTSSGCGNVSSELPRRVVDKVLGNLQHLPDAWPLMRFDLMLHKSSSFYAIWRRFLHLNEYLRNNLAPDTANATIDAHARGLTEHLVEFLAEWILMALEPALFIHHRLMRGKKSVHNSRIGAKPFVHCET